MVTSPDAPLSSDGSGAASRKPAMPRRKKRRSTSQIRKEEMQALNSELAALRLQLRQLSMRSVSNALDLRAQVEANHRTLAGAQSMLSSFTGPYWTSPFSTPIRLPADAQGRGDYLAAMYDHKVQLATDLLLERTRFLDLRHEHAHSERFEMPNGDFVVTRFEIAPFGRAFSVQRIFEETVQFTGQVEMSVTDYAGVVSVAEQDDAPAPGVRQSRIVTAADDGIDVETNFVMFSKFTEQDSRGVFTFDCVDEDERYSRNELSGRLRCEVVGAGLVVVCPSGDVSMVRWMSVCLRKPAVSLTKRQEIRIRENARAIGHVMVKAMQEKLGLR